MAFCQTEPADVPEPGASLSMALKKNRNDPRSPTRDSANRPPVIVSHLVLLFSGMILMFLIQFFLPERFRWFHSSAAPEGSPAYQNSGRRRPAHPWGDLQYMPIALSRPDGYFTNVP